MSPRKCKKWGRSKKKQKRQNRNILQQQLRVELKAMWIIWKTLWTSLAKSFSQQEFLTNKFEVNLNFFFHLFIKQTNFTLFSLLKNFIFLVRYLPCSYWVYRCWSHHCIALFIINYKDIMGHWARAFTWVKQI